MIVIRNTQRTIEINTERLRTEAETVLQALRYADCDLGILITTDATIRRYNKQYRNKDKATDILSFPYHELRAGERLKTCCPEDRNLGDIMISAPYVKRAAEELKVSFDDRMTVLLVHGICHLLGYDHENDADYAVMHRKERALLKKLGM
jgi:probable rRNA maturation factor